MKRSLLLFLLCGIVLSGVARAQSFSDAQIKAAYIFKLAKFVTVNGEHLNHINFCYLESPNQDADSSVGKSFAQLVRAKNAGGTWSTNALRSAEGIGRCNMLFIGDTEEGSLSSILAQTNGKDILTMSDARRFIYKDGMLGFVLDEDSRVKMEANLNNIHKTNVMISATVLELMQQVIK